MAESKELKIADAICLDLRRAMRDGGAEDLVSQINWRAVRHIIKGTLWRLSEDR